jgi:cytochrome P450
VRLLRPAIRDPLRLLIDLASYGDVVTVRRNRTFLVNSPDDIKRVFQDNHFNYEKGERYRRALEPLFGSGLLTAEGDLWRRQRRLIQPAFHRTHHPDYAKAIVAATRERLDTWREAARAGTPLDLRMEMTALTLAVLMKTIFGRSTGDDIHELGEAFLAAHHDMHIAAAFMPVRLPKWVPTPRRARFARAIGTIDRFVTRLVDEQRRGGSDGPPNFLSLLLAARDPDSGEAMSPQQLRDEVITMLAAGHDTVTEALTWTLYLVAQHAGIEDRVHHVATSVLGARDPSADDVRALTYIENVVLEAMRLYPPIWGIMRKAVAGDVLGGYAIPPGAGILISPYVVHRSAALWPDPERFLPDRFAPEQAAGRHRFAYFPFGAGPRQCVGAQFAMLEVPLVAAMLWREFTIRLVPGQTIRPLPRVSLRADRPVWAHVKERTT